MNRIEQFPEHIAADADHKPVFEDDLMADNCEKCGLAIVLHPDTGKWVHGLPE